MALAGLPGAQSPGIAAGQQITAEDAKALEEELESNPDDLTERAKLIQYYFQAELTSPSPELEEKRETHVFWLIERHFDSPLAGSPEAEIMKVGPAGNVDGYEHGKQLWLQQVGNHQNDLQVIRNAARFVFFSDLKLGRELLGKALAINGRIALRRGDMAGADRFLLAAGETPGSPQLDSFGPNMMLAKELLEKGERDTVVAYLQSCAKFWTMGGEKLQGWIATIKAGGTPDFGANLIY